ncbi:MAG: helix-turn-helix domain-containing protein [Candidatus Norongarragalinales archaeon]
MECWKQLSKHYARQKNESAARLRVRSADAEKIAAGRYTIYDFAENAFSFSPAKRALAIQVLSALRERPRSFAELAAEFSVPKSTLFLLATALQESGLVKQNARGGPLELSTEFADALRANAEWWLKWSKKK